mgnify:CR=1 FL=1|jgi:integrase
MAKLIKNEKAKNQPCWLIRYTVDGKEKQVTAHVTQTQAKRLLAKYVAQETIEKEFPPPKPTKTIESYYLSFLEYKQVTVKKSSYETYLHLLKYFVNEYGHSHPEDITISLYQEWQSKMLRTKVTATYNSIIRHTRAFVNWLKETEVITKTPKWHLQSEHLIDSKATWLNDKQLKLIMEAADQDLRELMTVLLHTGARIREVIHTPWEQVHTAYIELLDTKNNKSHEKLWLNKDASAIIERRRGTEPLLFNYHYSYVKDHIKAISNTLNIPFTAHSFRRTCGAILIKRGVGIYEVSKYLRHSSVTITEKHYLRLLKSDYINIAQILEN